MRSQNDSKNLVEKIKICPRCWANMNKFEHQSVLVDFCRNCGGTWWDEGELHQYLGIQKGELTSAELLTTYDENGPRCPKEQMLLQQYKIKKKIIDMIIDFCPACHGFFLDRGELGKASVAFKELTRNK